MHARPRGPLVVLLAGTAVLSWACSPTSAPESAAETAEARAPEALGDDAATQDAPIEGDAGAGGVATEDAATEGGATPAEDVEPAEICDAAGLATAVGGGAAVGGLAAMADEPAGAAIAATPVLSSLAAAVTTAGLVQTLDAAPALTILAPTDCAFAQIDAAGLSNALADPQGRLTTMLGYHIIAGEQIAAADLTGQHITFSGEVITLEGTDVDGQATIVVPDIQTANATVHLIDAVLVPPSLVPAPSQSPSEGAL